jgi:hypothetical protein
VTSFYFCVDLKEGKRILLEGLKNRQVAETTLNRDSSRSHSLFTLKLAQVPKNTTPDQLKADPTLVKYSRLTVVDLAGSERAYRTGALGERMKEASHINRSLMILGQVIEKLRHNQQHPKLPQVVVPFRDSQLTRLMQDYFQGSAKATLIVNINPSLADSDETLHVLKFASVAKTVKTTTVKKRVLANAIATPSASTIPSGSGLQTPLGSNRYNGSQQPSAVVSVPFPQSQTPLHQNTQALGFETPRPITYHSRPVADGMCLFPLSLTLSPSLSLSLSLFLSAYISSFGIDSVLSFHFVYSFSYNIEECNDPQC